MNPIRRMLPGANHAVERVGVWPLIFALLIVTVPLWRSVGYVPATDPQVYADLGFGLFVHYGINTYIGNTGWQGDPKDYPSTWFAPTDFDANQWAAAARSAGMHYLIYTAKHHYGWCGWDSAYTDYDVATSSAPTLDVVHEVAQAAKNSGLKLVIYYSIVDRYNYFINGYNQNPQYTQFVKDQLTELLTNYGEITAIWFDMANFATDQQLGEWYAHVQTLQPETLVLFNWRNDKADLNVFEWTLYPPEDNILPGERVDTAYTDLGWWATSDDDGPDGEWQNPAYVVGKMEYYNGLNLSFALGIPPGPSGKISASGIELLTGIGEQLRVHHLYLPVLSP